MKLLLLEFITGGGLHTEELPLSLANEGQRIYQAVLHDLLELNDIEIVTTCDPRVHYTQSKAEVYFENDIWSLWKRLMKQVDAVLLIAPETNGILLTLTQMAEACDCRILGCGSQSIALCTCKYKTLKFLKEHHISVVETQYLNQCVPHPTGSYVIKPDDGAGAEACYKLDELSHERLHEIYASTLEHKWIIQPYMTGLACSMTLLFKESDVDILAVNQQIIEIKNGKFELVGIYVNALSYLEHELMTLVKRIYELIPDLFGIIGIDFIYQNKKVFILEINPRPVSSYSVIYQSINKNPLEKLFLKHNQDRNKMCSTTQKHKILLDLKHAV